MADALIAIDLVVFGTVVNMYFAGMGFMPLDQSIVFDGAWRLLSGQVPFRDFATPNAVVPSIMQAWFFRVFGVTWFAYCLHASVINGLFAASAFALLRLCSATRLEAAVFSAFGAFLFYPPVGTPYMDQHAFFFGLLAMLAAIGGSVAAGPSGDRIAWALVPVALALAYLSKQIPTAFIGLCIAALIVMHRVRARMWMAASLGGLVIILAALIIRVLVTFSASEAWQYLVRMPLLVGAQRNYGRGVPGSLRIVLGTIRRLPSITGLWSIVMPASAIAIVPFARHGIREWRVLVWICATTVAVTGAFLAFTVNQPEDGVGLVFVGVGAALAGWRQALSFLLGAHPRTRRLAVGAVTVAVIAAGARDTYAFVRGIDATRIVLDSHFDPAEASRGQSMLPPALSYLQWTSDRYDAAEFSGLIAFLDRQTSNFVVIGDTSIAYGLTRRPSISPVLWFDPGLSMPALDTPEFGQLETELLRRMRELNVRFVVDEGQSTRNVTLASFPRLSRLVAAHQCHEERFGKTRVIELCKED